MDAQVGEYRQPTESAIEARYAPLCDGQNVTCSKCYATNERKTSIVTTQVQITVISYDESLDSFKVGIVEDSMNNWANIDATALALLVGECNDPDQFVGNVYTFERYDA